VPFPSDRSLKLARSCRSLLRTRQLVRRLAVAVGGALGPDSSEGVGGGGGWLFALGPLASHAFRRNARFHAALRSNPRSLCSLVRPSLGPFRLPPSLVSLARYRGGGGGWLFALGPLASHAFRRNDRFVGGLKPSSVLRSDPFVYPPRSLCSLVRWRARTLARFTRESRRPSNRASHPKDRSLATRSSGSLGPSLPWRARTRLVRRSGRSALGPLASSL
jgi:hypothetical protein